MQIVTTQAQLRDELKKQSSIAFVPTMGNLHAGHISLVDIAQQQAKTVVVSIFVNPLQFGQNEDFNKYPRTLEADCEKLKAAGVDVVFAPTVSELYPQFNAQTGDLGQTVTVEPPPIANDLCGAFRPGHFRGVATVVLKLFNMVQPQVAVFGSKDFQQLFIIREMVRQLDLPIEIIAGDTLREVDGLALSSRNTYLSPNHRQQATQLHAVLEQVRIAAVVGNRDFAHLEQDASKRLEEQGWQVDYVSVRSATTLRPPLPHEHDLVVLAAARLGNTRLIDNLQFSI